MKFTPHKGQVIGIKWLISHAEAGLLQDPGFGKTAETLAAFKQLRRTNAARKMLVVAPLRVCERVWTIDGGGEVSKWEDFQDLRVSFVHGKRKEEAADQDADIYTINYEGIDWLVGARQAARGRSVKSPPIADLVKRGVDIIVFDELSKMKNHSSQRFKQIRPHLGRFRRRWGLTGSPAANGLLWLFGEAFVLDMGKALGQYVTHYRLKYFMPAAYVSVGGAKVVSEWKPAEGAEARIYQALKPLMLSMRAEDFLSMPELVEQDVWVDLPDKARKFYEELEREMIAELDGETFVAGSAGVVSGKCRQIASGGLYGKKDEAAGTFTSGRAWTANIQLVHHIHDAKTEALCELVDELQGQPLLVGFEYKHDRARIAAALTHAKFIDGSTSSKDSAQIIADWNAGKVPVLCIHPAAAGHGLNLQGSNCAHVAWYTVPWDFDLYTQTNDRVYRQGNKSKTVFVHRILARNTVDVVVSRALRTKERTQDALMMALRDYAKGNRNG